MTIKDTRQEVNECIVHVCNNWNRTKLQLEFLQQTWRCLSDEHLAVQEETLKVLLAKLKTATDRLGRLVKKSKGISTGGDERLAIHRWKYPFFKPYLDDTIKSLDNWQRLYDPSWYLIIRIANSIIDHELKMKASAMSAKGDGLSKLPSAFEGPCSVFTGKISTRSCQAVGSI